MSDTIDDITFYAGAASGQQRSALRRLEPEAVMISYASAVNTRIPGDYELFVDSGGYHHMVNGTGEYERGDSMYLAYLDDIEADLWAVRDYPCEPDLLAELGRTVEEHQRRTTEKHSTLIPVAEQHDIPGRPVSVIQGWSIDDYLEHIDELRDRDLLTDYVGIGSVCRRHQDREIANIILRVRDALPARVDLHAFGVKGSVLRFREVVDALTSADSAAYDWAVSRGHRGRGTDESFTWRDSARSYLNWQHELSEIIGTVSMDDPDQVTLTDMHPQPSEIA